MVCNADLYAFPLCQSMFFFSETAKRGWLRVLGKVRSLDSIDLTPLQISNNFDLFSSCCTYSTLHVYIKGLNKTLQLWYVSDLSRISSVSTCQFKYFCETNEGNISWHSLLFAISAAGGLKKSCQLFIYLNRI